MTSLVIVAIIRATMKVCRHQACSGGVHLESYRSENSETAVVFSKVFDPINDEKVREYYCMIAP